MSIFLYLYTDSSVEIIYWLIVLEFDEAKLRAATNNFDLSRQLGSGGFGSVYRGFVNVTNVAVKVFSEVMGKSHFVSAL